MVLVKEYIIPMPLSVEEYRIAQLYMVAKFSKERTSKGEGITILKNEPYEDEIHGKGQYTHKQIHVGSSAPAWAKSLIPSNCCVEEKAWNAYPYVKTVYSCPLFGDRFSITSETRYFDDDQEKERENVFNLAPDVLATRELDRVDIVGEEVDEPHYKESEDPKLWVSKVNGRGKLQPDWRKTTPQRMVIHKLTKVEFKVWGIQTKAEQYLQKSMVRDIILLGHRQAYTWMDEWIHLTIEDIRRIEQETKIFLDKLMAGEINEKGEPIQKELTPKPQKKGWGWGSLTGSNKSSASNSPAAERKESTPSSSSPKVDEVEDVAEQVEQLNV